MITTRHKNHEADLVLTRESILFYPWSQWSLLMGQRSVSIPVLYPYSHSHREGKAQTQSLHISIDIPFIPSGKSSERIQWSNCSVLCRANINTWIFNTYHNLSVIGLYLKVFYTVIMHIYKLSFNLKFSPYHVINFSLLLILHEQS